MGIKKDIDEAKELWIGSSLLTKCLVILSLILTTSSVTSLSDVVFKWKGFILDAVNAYRSLISENVIKVFEILGISLSIENADGLVLAGIIISGSIRVQMSESGELRVLGKIYKSLSPRMFLIILVAAFLSSFSITIGLGIILGIINALLICIILMAALAYFSAKKSFYSFLAPIAFAVIVVLLLGAINAGLTRT